MKKAVFKKALAILLSVIMASLMLVSCDDSPNGTSSKKPNSGVESTGTLPRNETLYFNGLQWGTPSNFNPISASPAAFLQNNNPVPREVIYETLFMFNQLDGKLYGLLGKDYKWNDKILTVTLNPDAKWSDGKPFTAKDVVYTYELGKKYSLNISAIWTFIEGVAAIDEHTVQIKGKANDFKPKEIENSISAMYMMPEHIWSKHEKDCNNDGSKLMQIVNEKPVSTGPYTVQSFDETKIVLVRNDNYWGQAKSMFGKLAAPKYLVHNIFKDNGSGDSAFKAGQVDISQQFVSQIWKMWENDKLPIETYIPEAPYYVPGAIPSIVFNTTKPGLNDAAVRKAIAMSLNYDMIGKNAMSGYTAPMVPSLMLPTDPDQALIDKDALKPLQWGNADVEKANKLLDGAGWKVGSNGIREKNGVKLSFKVECPSGWTDWMAALEVVAQSSKAIGMDIQTYFPEASVWTNDQQTGKFDIIMLSYQGIGISSPWVRAKQTMYSVDLPEVGKNAYFNYGRYSNLEANKLIDAIASETDPAKAKTLWTELNKIYLTDVPAAGLMYRPNVFHQVNTSVWKGFPKYNDGSNIPPALCTDGYGIKGLYNLTAK